MDNDRKRRAPLVYVAAARSLAVLFATLTGCGPYIPFQPGTGLDSNASTTMLYEARVFLGCPATQIQHTDLGRIPGTAWYRHTYSGCGGQRIYWTGCGVESCDEVVDGLEERAALDFNCTPAQITVTGVGQYMRATGCGSSAVYVDQNEQWVLNPMCAVGSSAPAPIAQTAPNLAPSPPIGSH